MWQTPYRIRGMLRESPIFGIKVFGFTAVSVVDFMIVVLCFVL